MEKRLRWNRMHIGRRHIADIALQGWSIFTIALAIVGMAVSTAAAINLWPQPDAFLMLLLIPFCFAIIFLTVRMWGEL